MMLIHIILGILKIIGILLLVLLCLLLLLLLSLVFVPVRYYGSAFREEGKYEGKVRVSWLFHLIFVTARYGSGTEGLQLSIRFLGIPVDVVLKKIAAWRQKRQKKKPELTAAEEKKTPPGEGTETEEQAAIPAKEPRSAQQALLETEKESSVNAVGTEKDAETKNSAETKDFAEKKKPAEKKNPAEKKSPAAKLRSVFEKISEIIKKLLGLPGKIKAAFVNFRRTAKEIYGKIEQIRELLASESFLGAKTLVFGELGIIMRHVRPRKIKGDIYFGFDDPALTGQVLAGASIFYPLYGRGLSLHPYFDRVILEGRAQIWGRMYGFMFLRTVWKLFRDANVRDLRKKFKNK